MNEISWGKPRIFIKPITRDGAWKEVPTPVEDSTTLATTKGDKMEALIEGGEAEAVKYKKNTYELSYQVRLLAGRNLPFPETDGVILGDYAVAVVPENQDACGVLIERSNVSSEDTYSSADGISVTYTHSALKPTSGNQVKYGVITVAGNVPTHFDPIEEGQEATVLPKTPAS